MKKTTWINDKGNFCFFWEKDSYKGVLSFFSAILIVLIVSGIIDYFWVKGICSRVLIGVFIAMFIAYNYVNHKSNKKDAILLSIIFISSSITYHLYVLFGSHCTLLAVTCISPEPIGIVND